MPSESNVSIAEAGVSSTKGDRYLMARRECTLDPGPVEGLDAGTHAIHDFLAVALDANVRHEPPSYVRLVNAMLDGLRTLQPTLDVVAAAAILPSKHSALVTEAGVSSMDGDQRPMTLLKFDTRGGTALPPSAIEPGSELNDTLPSAHRDSTALCCSVTSHTIYSPHGREAYCAQIVPIPEVDVHLDAIVFDVRLGAALIGGVRTLQSPQAVGTTRIAALTLRPGAPVTEDVVHDTDGDRYPMALRESDASIKGAASSGTWSGCGSTSPAHGSRTAMGRFINSYANRSSRGYTVHTPSTHHTILVPVPVASIHSVAQGALAITAPPTVALKANVPTVWPVTDTLCDGVRTPQSTSDVVATGLAALTLEPDVSAPRLLYPA